MTHLPSPCRRVPAVAGSTLSRLCGRCIDWLLVAGLCASAVAAHAVETHAFGGGPLALPPGPSQAPYGMGPADPYPAIINVQGIPDDHIVVDFEVVLIRITHVALDHLDLLLVAPNGASSILLSDARGLFLRDTTIRLRDDADPVVDIDDSGGVFAPTDIVESGRPDIFPAPAPQDGWGTALAPLTVGNVNGSWRLFAVDDAIGLAGWMDGWALVFKTESEVVDSPFPPTPVPTPPIPEPATALLWMAGAALLSWRLRSRA